MRSASISSCGGAGPGASHDGAAPRAHDPRLSDSRRGVLSPGRPRRWPDRRTPARARPRPPRRWSPGFGRQRPSTPTVVSGWNPCPPFDFERRDCRSGRGQTRRPPPTLRSRSPAIEDDREGQPGVPPGALRDARRGPGRRCRPEPDIEVVARRPTGATRCRRPSTWPDNRADRHRDAADDRPRACGRTGPPGPVDSRHRADHVRPPQRYLCRALDAAAAGYPLKDAPSASRRRSRSAVRVAGGSRTRQTVWTPSPSLSVGARQICEMPLQAAFADGPDGPGGRCRVGEAGGVRGGPRLSGPRQVCDPGVVHPAGRGGRPTRCRVDGVAAIPAAGDDSIPGDSASGNL